MIVTVIKLDTRRVVNSTFDSIFSDGGGWWFFGGGLAVFGGGLAGFLASWRNLSGNYELGF